MLHNLLTLWHVRFRWRVWPRQVTGDTKYGTIENIVAIERERIRAYVPLSAVGGRYLSLPRAPEAALHLAV